MTRDGTTPGACPTCGRAPRPGARFCDGCGRPLESRPTANAVRAELRSVTVLFADLQGFTSLAESMDPDDVHEVVQRIFAVTDAGLRAHRGHVEKHMGDAVMAVFGHPTAREDDARRAVRAALAIQEELRALADALVAEGLPRLALRIGINTGRVLVGQVGAAGGGETSVYGDPVNVAARLESVCPPGGVLVSEDTWRQVAPYFEARAQPPVRVKGKREPLSTWRVVAERAEAPIGTRAEVLGVRTRLIGRDEEMRVLADAWARRGEGPGLVTVLGAPGTGKSRLAEELVAEVSDQGARVLRARGAPETAAEPYHVLALAVRDAARLPEGAPADAVHAGLAGWLGEPPGSSAVLGLSELLGLGPAGEVPGDPRHALSTLRRAFLGTGDDPSPRVLVVDDAQWADPATLDYLVDLLASTAAAPLLVIATARPELLEMRPGWGEALPRATRVWLDRLDDEANRRLVLHLLHRVEGLPTSLVDELAGRSGGVPYFAEEMVKSLADRGIVEREGEGWRFRAERLRDFDIPGTVEGLLQARLDRLDPPLLQAARLAAVLGRSFSAGALRALLADASVALLLSDAPAPERVEPLLVALAAREIVRREEGEPDRWIFVHDLMRDVAYRTLVKRVRRKLHGQVARWMEAQAGDAARRIEASALARHLRLAERPRDAVRWHVRAAEASRDVGAPTEALSQLDDALSLLRELGETTGPLAVDIFGLRGDMLTRLGRIEAAEADYRRAVELGEDAGDRAAVVHAHAGLAFCAYHRGDADDTLAHAERAAGLVGGLDDLPLQMQVHNILGIAWGSRGYFERAIGYYERAAGIAERLGNRRRQAIQLSNIALNHNLLGDFETARTSYERALEIAREIEDPDVEGVLLDNMGFVHLNLGAPREAVWCFQRAVALSRLHEDHGVLPEALTGLGQALLELGDATAAAELGRESLALASQSGMKPNMGQALRLLGRAAAEGGDAGADGESAESLLLRSVELLRETGERQELAESLLALGELLEARGEGDRGAARRAEARAIFADLGMGWRIA